MTLEGTLLGMTQQFPEFSQAPVEGFFPHSLTSASFGLEAPVA